jgi:nucleoside-diphosphate-sugar epimerase
VRVLVTGANGHLGCNVIRELLRQGHEPVPLVRPGADLRGLAGLSPTAITGDIQDSESVADAASGCEAILHLAAVYRTRSDSPAEILAPAIVGTRNVLRAAARHWIRLPYFRAKLKAEREAWKMAVRDALRWLAFLGKLPAPTTAHIQTTLPPDGDWTST